MIITPNLVIIFFCVVACIDGLKGKYSINSDMKKFKNACISCVIITSVVTSAILTIDINSDSVEAKTFPQCITESNPQATIISCRQIGLKDDNRLLGCQANENCFSTSATSPSKYSSPWKYSRQNTEQAWALLKGAVLQAGLKVNSSFYLLFTCL